MVARVMEKAVLAYVGILRGATRSSRLFFYYCLWYA